MHDNAAGGNIRVVRPATLLFWAERQTFYSGRARPSAIHTQRHCQREKSRTQRRALMAGSNINKTGSEYYPAPFEFGAVCVILPFNQWVTFVIILQNVVIMSGERKVHALCVHTCMYQFRQLSLYV